MNVTLTKHSFVCNVCLNLVENIVEVTCMRCFCCRSYCKNCVKLVRDLDQYIPCSGYFQNKYGAHFAWKDCIKEVHHRATDKFILA